MANRDLELEAVEKALLGENASVTQNAIGWVLRDTIDQLLDGQHTGRYRWEQLFKTEKTHAGTMVEINLQRAMQFVDGDVLDFKIAGVEVDCKFSQSIFGWMIPPEAVGHLCMVVWASDAEAKWSLGLVRASPTLLSDSQNRDGKRTLSRAGQTAVKWLFDHAPLPPNVYLGLREEQVKDILNPAISGQKRVNKLFIHAQRRIVGRGAVATAAQQDDFLKRVRENGGAREKLRPLGIVIFGHEHEALTRGLGLPTPHKGEFVSARLVLAERGAQGAVEIGQKWWRLAAEHDPQKVDAPLLPRADRHT
ncbi:restriction endonuclease [Aggregicoccus sp. 17bor-14]|uniref:NaeI family type II restriction endonuclease n=1 Tax=Myxococcaceae TaxID=31 RepID=UPI00129CC966|nr:MULTISPECIES: NaeI family type II restriction endonuclease [Myxococcaceae]MBF5044506.1 restriction endonuclease [Simulacricoccus sp. 17bor-14]MRI90251.1 restriction endonuclease [Aggregicoccus sp. 17bor-14]